MLIYTCIAVSTSWVMQGVMSDVPASHGHKGGFAIQHMVKDLRLATDAAAHVSSPAPMTEKAMEIYAKVW